jgi:hypothetical protein
MYSKIYLVESMVVGLHVLGYQYMSNNVVSCCYILHWNLCIYKLSFVCFVNYNISPPEKVKFYRDLVNMDSLKIALRTVTLICIHKLLWSFFKTLKIHNTLCWLLTFVMSNKTTIPHDINLCENYKFDCIYYDKHKYQWMQYTIYNKTCL